MIDFLPIIAEDETLYSIIQRYHSYSSNGTNEKRTISEFWGMERATPYIMLPNYLISIEKQFKRIGLNVNDIINRFTMLPYIKCFITRTEYENIKYRMIYTKGAALYSTYIKVARNDNSIYKIKYCPICAKKDLRMYSDVIIHRIPQIEEAFVCYKHGCFYNEYKRDMNKYKITDKKLEGLSIKNINMQVRYPDNYENNILIFISNEIAYLLNMDLNIFKDDLLNVCRSKLIDSGYFLDKDMLIDKKLVEDMNYYYKQLNNYKIHITKGERSPFTSRKFFQPEPIDYIILVKVTFGSIKNLITTLYTSQIKH